GPAGGQDRLDVEVAVRGRGGAQPHCHVGGGHVRGAGVGVGVDGGRTEAHGAQGADHAHGDLPAVGNEYCVEHGHILNRPKVVSGSGPAQASSAKPSTRRVSAGAMTPSSHSRAVEYQGLPWVSYCSRIGALKASSSCADHWVPGANPSRLTVASTL